MHLQVYKNLSYVQIIFRTVFADQGFLGKDPTLWLDGARPANTCIPPSFLRKVSKLPCSIPPMLFKYIWKYKELNLLKSMKINTFASI